MSNIPRKSMTDGEKLDVILQILNGNGKLGLRQKMDIMWRGGVLLIAGCGVGVGLLAEKIIDKLF